LADLIYGTANLGILADIDSKCNELELDLDYVRLPGADAEHRQQAKSINAKLQKKLREEKRRRKLTEKSMCRLQLIMMLLISFSKGIARLNTNY
jgi:hypothetical protein